MMPCREDLTWLICFLMDRPDCSAIVFNDGPPLAQDGMVVPEGLLQARSVHWARRLTPLYISQGGPGTDVTAYLLMCELKCEAMNTISW